MIISMKKAHLVVLKEDKERLLKSLQKYGELMLIKTSDTEEAHDSSVENQYLQRIEKTLKDLKPYQEEEKQNRLVVDYAEFMTEDPQRQVLLEKIEQASGKITQLQTENNTLLESIKLLQPWRELDINLSRLTNLKYANLHLGLVELRYVSSFMQMLTEYGCEVNLLGKTFEGQALVFANYYKDNEEILEKAKNYGFSEQSLPVVDKLVIELINEKQNIIEQNQNAIMQLEAELTQLSQDIDEIHLLNDQIYSKNELEQAYSQETIHTTYLEGWVRKDRIERLEQSIKEATDIYDLEITDPLPDENPPTVTENNQFTKSFEVITDMFSKPNPYEVDPSPVMSIWYWILFGIMMGDAGYGLVMAVFSFLFIKFKKPKGGTLKILKVFLYSSIPTIAWGILFGSYFGVTWDPLKQLGTLLGYPNWKSIAMLPMEQPLQMLILSIVIGLFHVLTGILMKAYRNFVDKNYFAIFADQFSWFLILVGIGFLALPATSFLGFPMIITGAIIVVFTAGRFKKKVFGKAVSGLLALYSVTGYLSDILSYSRILALALSSAVIAMVMNMLAGMVIGSIPVLGFIFAALIFIFGHVFNLGMGLLSAYVHDSRLQYIEFFGKFYDGGGYEFRPLSLKLKYVDTVKNIEKN